MLTVSKPLEDQINQCHRESGQSVESLLDRMLTEYIQDREDAAIADGAYRKYLESGEKGIPLEQIMRENDLLTADEMMQKVEKQLMLIKWVVALVIALQIIPLRTFLQAA